MRQIQKWFDNWKKLKVVQSSWRGRDELKCVLTSHSKNVSWTPERLVVVVFELASSRVWCRCRPSLRRAMMSAEDPPTSMNERVFHVEIVILTTYISIPELLWKSNWCNYKGRDVCQGVGGFPSTEILPRQQYGNNTQTTRDDGMLPDPGNLR